MTPRKRLRIAPSSVLPTLIAVVIGEVVLAVADVLPWTVLPPVLVALSVQVVVTHLRLGRSAGANGRTWARPCP